MNTRKKHAEKQAQNKPSKTLSFESDTKPLTGKRKSIVGRINKRTKKVVSPHHFIRSGFHYFAFFDIYDRLSFVCPSLSYKMMFVFLAISTYERGCFGNEVERDFIGCGSGSAIKSMSVTVNALVCCGVVERVGGRLYLSKLGLSVLNGV